MHENLSASTRTFKPNTRGAELVSDLKMASKNIFIKYKGNALSAGSSQTLLIKTE